MFVKKSWSKRNGNRHVDYHICRSYRNEDGDPRHEYLVNLTPLPEEVIHKIDQALKGEGDLAGLDQVEVATGDTCPGAGTLAIWRGWRKTELDKALSDLTEAQRKSVFAMILGRILSPGSKLGLKERLADNVFARSFSKNRLDEDELYAVMDQLEASFYSIQSALREAHTPEDPQLLLYDTTTTYFEGSKAEGVDYGKSKDHRWDRYQIVIGLVTDKEGTPLAIETWKGNTQDRATFTDRVDQMVEAFGIEEATFVSDEGTYSDVNIAYLKKNDFDYITSLEWHRQREKLEGMAPKQRKLFKQVGVYEWTEQIAPQGPEGEEQPHQVRYVGVFSKPRQVRQRRRRLANMKEARDLLEHLSETAAKGRYYTPNRLRQKIQEHLKKLNVSTLFEVEVSPKGEGEGEGSDQKQLLDVAYRLCLGELRKRRGREGKYILQTSLSKDQADGEQVDEDYRRLQQVEKGFRDIKNFLKIRPVYHRKLVRIRAHVLICFLAYYLTHWIKEQFRQEGMTCEVVPKLRYMDKLELVKTEVSVEDQSRTGYSWSLGEVGMEIREQLKELGWWRSIQGYKRSVLKQLE